MERQRTDTSIEPSGVRQAPEDFLETQAIEREKRDVTNEQEPEDPTETDDVESEKRG